MSQARTICRTVLLAGVVSVVSASAQEPRIDFERARVLQQRQRAGETLTAEERVYLEKARAARQEQPRGKSANRPVPADRGAAPKPRESLGLRPVDEFGPSDTYKGYSGGLYGEGRNEPPLAHRAAAMEAARSIRPLGPDGSPDPDGKIVLISNGMSNTTREFQVFVTMARQEPEINPRLVVVDCAQGGQEAGDWARSADRFRRETRDPWEVQAERLRQAGVTPAQVQVVWMKQARRQPASLGEFPKHAQVLQADQAEVLRHLKRAFPNLKLAYLSSRIYAGYAGTQQNPEPYAYESAWANQWLIQQQISGDPALNFDASRGEVKAPVILWGPYLWADGVKGRRSDDLVYGRSDLVADGTHPSEGGTRKVSQQLLSFFKRDPTSRPWFVKDGSSGATR